MLWWQVLKVFLPVIFHLFPGWVVYLCIEPLLCAGPADIPSYNFVLIGRRRFTWLDPLPRKAAFMHDGGCVVRSSLVLFVTVKASE